jgi:hypothetical protein
MEPPIPSPEPLFDAIGRVAVSWSAMELELGRLLPALLHTPRADLLTTGQSFGVLERQLKAFVDLPPALEQYDVPRERLTDAQRARLREVWIQSNALSKERQRIIHGVWVPTTDPTTWAGAKPRQYALFVRPEVITLAEIHKVALDIDALSHRTQRLAGNLDHRLNGLTEAPPLDDPE